MIQCTDIRMRSYLRTSSLDRFPGRSFIFISSMPNIRPAIAVGTEFAIIEPCKKGDPVEVERLGVLIGSCYTPSTVCSFTSVVIMIPLVFPWSLKYESPPEKQGVSGGESLLRTRATENCWANDSAEAFE